MKFLTKIFTLIGCVAYLGVLAAADAVPSNADLQEARNEFHDSIQNLADVKENKELTAEEKEKLELEASKKALRGVIEFSIAETESLIERLESLDNLKDRYAELRDSYLASWGELLQFQKDYLLKLDDNELDLVGVKKLASVFKKWRAEVYDPAVRDVLNFLLVLQGNNVLAVAVKRHSNIAGDLNLLKNSKIIKVDVLLPLLEGAGLLLDDASLLSAKANNLLFDASSTPARINGAANSVLAKVKQAYGKFLEMSALVRKMLGK